MMKNLLMLIHRGTRFFARSAWYVIVSVLAYGATILGICYFFPGSAFAQAALTANKPIAGTLVSMFGDPAASYNTNAQALLTVVLALLAMATVVLIKAGLVSLVLGFILRDHYLALAIENGEEHKPFTEVLAMTMVLAVLPVAYVGMYYLSL